MERVTLQVTGMTCGGCENAVKRAVARLEGVSNVTASHADNQVTVEYDHTLVDRTKIATAIAKAGYTAS
jgi:copper ion binding protein